MKPLFHSSSFCFFSLSLLMILIINIPTCLCEDDGYYKNCNTAFICGDNKQDLRYPFWGGTRESYCGGVADDINTMLTCEEKVSKITINNLKYRILDWDNTTQKLTVARDDYWSGNVCDVNTNIENSTFDNTQFQRYSDDVANVTLLYGCNVGAVSLLTPFYDIGCGGSEYVIYTIVYSASLSSFCTPTRKVVIPIFGTQAAQLGSGNGTLSEALKDGFELKWIGNYTECQSCVTYGGACGNDGGNQFRCFCNDGTHATSCHSPSVPSTTTSSKLNWRPIVIGAAGFVVIVFFIIIMIRCHLKRGIGRQQKSIFENKRELVEHNVDVYMQNYNLSMPRRYSYTEVKWITSSFREKLGQGGYGVVYKASLNDGRQVAVKLINESKGNGEEFVNEVASISRTSHMNIVSLLGFCYEGNKRALIYEFMPKGSLDRFIYKSEFPNAICDFDWNTLFQIAIGIARGLDYLHQGCNSRILHLDIKPQNVLLDEDFCPKISDFGLAKICQRKDSIVSKLGVRGTIGYMAPEIFSRAFGGVSYKSDVYSYGMLILEMIGGRKNYDTRGSCTSEMYFPDWIYKDLEQGNTSNTLLNSLTISEEENDMVRKITLVSLWCIQTNPSDRPPMNKVIEMLQGPLSSVPYPPKPVLFSPERPALPVECISSSDFNETSSITVSN
ncbi:LEAF RUST 10 DISEASE-RESISTANCE LOCUS RECEPTOR-LIKE PROTEIN KINASE-like 2.1 [Lathyrus oleraceus]|nr:LEAF RUST 10 DISEASE-RESISTANCE LOCUS RECEPTOR-LIKE PROTEIN KINASE-like 2.1 [Pisum sativum]